MLGPVPAPMARRGGRRRAQLLLQSGQREALQRLLDRWVPQLERMPSARRVRWSLDVDPIELF
jgi:primosomal protein N' (replication factor Y)